MNFTSSGFSNILKRIFECVITFICLLLLSPVIVILAILIKVSGKGPVIYSQKRMGRNGGSFSIYKFRSMYYGEEDGILLISDRDDKRITKLGRFMRKYRFDEIPNLLNVLKGDMSLIGPRPEQQFYINQIIQREPRYRELQVVKPGITSWGQVKYGYASNTDEMIKRLEYDLYYLEHRSLMFDLKIAFFTFIIIIKGQGI